MTNIIGKTTNHDINPIRLQCITNYHADSTEKDVSLMTRLGCLNGRDIIEGYDENKTLAEAAEETVERFSEIAPILAQGFSAFRTAKVPGNRTRNMVD